MTELVFDAGDRDFETAVLARSKQTPVVVDFWAPWCAPCRTLGPLLERLTQELAGQFLLAKVNVDENPGLAAALNISSIPMVIGFRDGQPVAEFVGAVPEAAVREFLAQVLPSAADTMSGDGDALRAAGKLEEAESKYRQALELDSRNEQALFGLAIILTGRGEDKQALRLLDGISAGTLRQEAARLAAEIRVRQGGSGDEESLRAKLAADAGDLESRFLLAQVLAARGSHDEALAEYLEIVRRDRRFRDDAARKAMLDLFDMLGPEHALTSRYRSELAKILFS